MSAPAPEPATHSSAPSQARTLGWLGLLFFAEGLPFGIFAEALPIYLRGQGASLAMVGTVGSLQLAWSLKLLWSPLVQSLGTWRRWVAGSAVVMAAALAGLAQLSGRAPLASASLAMGALCLLALFALASATSDLAIDGATVGMVAASGEGLGNGVRVTTYRAALLVGGGGMVALSDRLPWSQLLTAAACAMAAMAVVPFLVPAAAAAPLAATKRPPLWPMLRAWASAPGGVGCLLLLCSYKFGDLAMASMSKPFWLSHGRSAAEIGQVAIWGGMAASTVGALAGGTYVNRRGVFRGIWVLGIWQAVSNLGYAAVALGGLGVAPLYAASLFESLTQGLGTAAQLSMVTRLCQREDATVQFALMTALFGLGRSAAGLAGGFGAQWLGYGPFFIVSFLACLPAAACLPSLRRRLAWQA